MGRFRARPRTAGRLAGIVAIAVALTVAACGSSPRGSATSQARTAKDAASGTIPVTLRVGIYPGSFYTWLPYLAEAQGFFARNGVSAHLVDLSNGPVAFAALASGSADMVDGDLSLAGPFIERGVGLSVLSGSTDAGWELVAPAGSPLPGISAGFPVSVRGLRGKTVAVWGLGSSSYYVARFYVSQAHVPAGAVTYVAAGGPVQSVETVIAKRVAAAIEAPDAAFVLTHIFHASMLFDPAADPQGLPPAIRSLVGRPSGALWVRTSWAKANPKAAASVQLALLEADLWMHQPASFARVEALLEQGQQLPSVVKGAEVAPFVHQMLGDIEAYYPPASARMFSKFWVSAGLLSKAIPASSQVLPSVPATQAAVEARVDAATKVTNR